MRFVFVLVAIFFAAANSFAQNVVVSSYRNDAIAGGDPRDEWTELLVIDDNVDLRNYTLRDNNSTQTAWQTPITFNNTAFWNNMRAGTIIIVWHRAVGSNTVTHPLDINKSDGYIEVHANDPAYFTGGDFGTAPSFAGSTLNISNGGDIIQLRNPSGIHIHALAHRATVGADFTALPSPKLNHQQNLASQKAVSVFVCPGTNLQEYGWNSPQNGTAYTDTSSLQVTKGLPNQCTASSTANSDYWRSLRQPLWNTPGMFASFTAPAAIHLDWTASVDPNTGDGTQGYIILRNLVNSFTAPTDGHTYTAGNTIGTSVVVAVIPSSLTLTYTDSYALTCGETIYYRIYPYRYGTDEINGNDYHVARGRAYNETNFAAASVSRAAGPVISSVLPTSPSCGLSNGSIYVFASGGAGILQYSIDNGATWFQNGGVFSNLGPGSYYIVVKDASNCQTAYGFNPVMLNASSAATIDTVTHTDATCGNSDGSITVTASGGAPPLQYSIDNGATWQANPLFTNLAAGNYYVFVQDDDSCQTAYASNPEVIGNTGGATIDTVLVTNATCGLSNGSIAVYTSGGSSPIEYSLDNGATLQLNPVFSGLAPGSYFITVRDANGCNTPYLWNPVVVASLGSPSVIDVNINPSTCGQSDGSITIDAAYGTPPLQYSINGGADYYLTNIFTGLAQGNYTIMVSDANNCTGAYATNPAVVSNISGAAIDSLKVISSTCGNSNGSITIYASGGTYPISYSIDDGLTWSTDSAAYNSLPAGSYRVVIKDNNYCLTYWPSNPVAVGNTGGATIDTVIVTDASCGSDGAINIVATGGTAPVSYSIDNGITWNTLPQFLNLSPGNYTVLTTDANNCQIAYSYNNVTISSLSGSYISSVMVSDATCSLPNGEITLMTTGSPPPIQYSIDGGLTWQDSAHFTGLAADTYDAAIMGLNNCLTPYPFNPVYVQNEAAPSVLAAGTDATCNEDNGIIEVSTSGGKQPFLYSIDNGSNWQDSAMFRNLATGNYLIAVTDSNNCTSYFQNNPLEIKRIPVEDISLSQAGTLCSGQEWSLTPGSGFETYLWQDGSALPAFTATAEGLYWVMVTDTNGCISADTVNIVKCPDAFEVPSAFSPNLDGLNEVFRVTAFHPEKILQFRMYIFNRWGQLIFETNSLLGYWDGRYKGLPCDDGVYSYLIEFRLEDGYKPNQESPMRGTVTIVR